MRISDWSSDVCSSDLLQRIVSIPRDTPLLQQVCELLHAVSVQTVERRRRLVRANVALDSGYQFFECLLTLEPVQRVSAGNGAAAFDSSDNNGRHTCEERGCKYG